MLTQAEADNLLDILKNIVEQGHCILPKPGEYKNLNLKSINGKHKFIVDINRRGSIKLSKCTFQKRYNNEIILLRLDIDGPDHRNPNGQEIPCPHLHIYREGYGEKWAIPLPEDLFTNTKDLVTLFIEFLQYCKVNNLDEISIQGGLFDDH